MLSFSNVKNLPAILTFWLTSTTNTTKSMTIQVYLRHHHHHHHTHLKCSSTPPMEKNLSSLVSSASMIKPKVVPASKGPVLAPTFKYTGWSTFSTKSEFNLCFNRQRLCWKITTIMLATYLALSPPYCRHQSAFELVARSAKKDDNQQIICAVKEWWANRPSKWLGKSKDWTDFGCCHLVWR